MHVDQVVMRIGLDHYTIQGRGWTAEEVVAFAVAEGLEGVQFTRPSQIDPALDVGRLGAFGDRMREVGLYVEVGVGSPNPAQVGVADPAEVAAGLIGELEAAAAVGVGVARAYVGDRHARFRADVPWAEQLRQTELVLGRLAPRLRELGLRLALETHADVRASELLGLIERLGPEVLGVTLDTGNLAMRLEDPVRVVERLAPWVLMTHVKDAVLAFTERGLCWQARPVGEGVVPIAAILGVLGGVRPALNLSIELHPRTYDLPIYDRTWLGYFPGLEPGDLAAVVRLAARAEERFGRGEAPRPEAVEAIPWEERELDWIRRSAAWLRQARELWRGEAGGSAPVA